METIRLADQQSLRIGGRSAPLVRKPTGQVLRIQQNGRLTTATTEAKCRLADRRVDQGDRLDASWGATPYTRVSG
jgi:hypothetical protein